MDNTEHNPKKIAIIILAAVFLLPIHTYKLKDGGTRVFSPILPIYCIERVNSLGDIDHEKQLAGTIKGIRIMVFGQLIYENTHQEWEEYKPNVIKGIEQ